MASSVDGTGLSYAENELKYRLSSRQDLLRVTEAVSRPEGLLPGYEPVGLPLALVGRMFLNRYYDTPRRDLFWANHTYRLRTAANSEGQVRTHLQFKESTRQEGAWFVRREVECHITGWDRSEESLAVCRPYIVGQQANTCHTALAEALGLTPPVPVELVLTVTTYRCTVLLRRLEAPFAGVEAFEVSLDQVVATGEAGDTRFLEVEIEVIPGDTPERRQSGYLSAVLADLRRLEGTLSSEFALEPSPRPKYQVAVEALTA